MSKRVPQEFIHSLLAKVDIVDVIGARVDLKKKGVNHSGRCPFHQEKTPSFSVSQPKQFYYCFGCGAHGNAIRFLMDYDKLEFLEAVEELAHSVGMEVPAISTGFVAEQSNDLDLIYQVLNEASLFYQKQLRQHPAKQEAINYMKGRGLTGETAKTFHLGFSPESWDALLSALGTTPQRVEALSSAGLIIRRENGQFYDRFRHRIMFPIRDRRGRVIGFGGRVLKPEEQPKYLNSPETPVFHKGHELYGLYEAKRSLLKIQ
ncbi:MAG: DNA primase, partial [Gammaproteobacteria bacterium]|nr:DNA primase [Gammaproteobacteria bacterium]